MTRPTRSTERSTAGGGRRASPVVLATAAAVVVAAAAAGLSLLTLPGASNVLPPVPAAAGLRPVDRVDATGRLLLPLDGGLARLDLPGRTLAELVQPGRSGAVTSARWAPDGRSAAYAYYHLRQGDSSASSEIFISDFAGEARLAVERDRPGVVIESPSWSPDGRALFYSYTALENQRVARRIERVDLETGVRTVVGPGAWPSVSPDGASLALVQGDGGGDSLVVADSGGGNARVLIPSGRFTAIGQARYAPDGATLAVPLSQPATAGDDPLRRPFAGLAPPLAHAHGDPWEVYVVDLGTGSLRRLTRLAEDEISVAWSPAGDQIAVYGTRGLFLVGVDGSTTFAFDRGGFGGIDWAP